MPLYKRQYPVWFEKTWTGLEDIKDKEEEEEQVEEKEDLEME